MDVPGQALVALRDQFRTWLDGMFAQMFLEQFACDPSAPDLIGVRGILRPWGLLPAQLDGAVALEIRRLIELFLDLGDAIIDALQVEIVNLVGWLEIPEKHIVIERRCVFRRQRVDVLLGEKEVAEVEQLQVGLEELFRDFVVERLVGVMSFLEEAANRGSDVSCVRLRIKSWRSGVPDGQHESQQAKT